MRKSRRISRRRGFTLVELAVTCAVAGSVVALTGGLALELIQRKSADGGLRQIVASIRRARSLAANGVAEIDGVSVRTRAAGVRFASGSVVATFVDPDEDPNNGNEATVATTLLFRRGASAQVTQPATGVQIRFERDGSTAPAMIEVVDRVAGLRRRIFLTGAGQMKIE